MMCIIQLNNLSSSKLRILLFRNNKLRHSSQSLAPAKEPGDANALVLRVKIESLSKAQIK